MLPVARRPLASLAQGGAVEDEQGIGHGHGVYVGPKRGAG
jgi:hypothetical protein